MTLFQTLKFSAILGALFCAGTSLAAPPCPEPRALQAEQLHGQWTAQVTGQPRIWFLQLGPHPEHTGSLRGEINTGSQRLPVVADLDDGDFTLEESQDGQHISATWLGTVHAGSCGQSLSGQRQTAQGQTTPFVMRRNQPR
ncbi:hypothetical protein [Limnohabitans sp. DM1]|uniref:hypothetical protein n=1 Tax=Limnohabitans sp. DM1 TaxID=1597955 RepID=UPI000B21A736|nr:hypothetical protein [Limnohabitans sp. DM1]